MKARHALELIENEFIQDACIPKLEVQGFPSRQPGVPGRPEVPLARSHTITQLIRIADE